MSGADEDAQPDVAAVGDAVVEVADRGRTGGEDGEDDDGDPMTTIEPTARGTRRHSPAMHRCRHRPTTDG